MDEETILDCVIVSTRTDKPSIMARYFKASATASGDASEPDDAGGGGGGSEQNDTAKNTLYSGTAPTTFKTRRNVSNALTSGPDTSATS